jgi:hypothetical protein
MALFRMNDGYLHAVAWFNLMCGLPLRFELFELLVFFVRQRAIL